MSYNHNAYGFDRKTEIGDYARKHGNEATCLKYNLGNAQFDFICSKDALMIRVEAFQTSDGQWHLQSYAVKSQQVFMLLTFTRLIDLLEAACTLQIRIDNELPLNQYYMIEDTGVVSELVS